MPKPIGIKERNALVLYTHPALATPGDHLQATDAAFAQGEPGTNGPLVVTHYGTHGLLALHEAHDPTFPIWGWPARTYHAPNLASCSPICGLRDVGRVVADLDEKRTGGAPWHTVKR